MNSITFATEIRKRSVEMVHRARASHIGGALSMVDILAVLYSGVLRYRADDPSWDGRDRFILSKGHTCVSLYATLALKGFFPEIQLDTYGENGSLLLSHISHLVKGVEFSAGSLGHGLPIAAGLALAAKRQGKAYRTYVIVGDGEMDEGSNWEALMFAAHHKLDNLCVIIDYNKIQSLGTTCEVMDLEPLCAKLQAFRCHATRIDGHDHAAINAAFQDFEQTTGSPTVIVADTVKGKGVSYMENNLAWHYKSPNDEQLATAIKDITQ